MLFSAPAPEDDVFLSPSAAGKRQLGSGLLELEQGVSQTCAWVTKISVEFDLNQIKSIEDLLSSTQQGYFLTYPPTVRSSAFQQIIDFRGEIGGLL